MLSKKKLDRINALAKKAKKQGLSKEELIEQKKLRKEYLKKFRKNFRSRLENITVVETQEEYDRLMKQKKEQEEKKKKG